jgi:hypothetical protein
MDWGPPTAHTRAHWRRRLTRLLAVRAPHKSEKDIEEALDHFTNEENGGFEEMWKQATTRFGTDPSDSEVRRAYWRKKLQAYFLLVDSSQTPQDVEESLDYFEGRAESFEGMWEKVQKRYNFYVNIEPSGDLKVDDVTLRRSPDSAAAGIISPRVCVLVLVGGLSYKLYQQAAQEDQFRFNSAVAAEVRDCGEFPNTLIVTKVSEHVEGMMFEMDTVVVDSTQKFGSLLVHHTQCGGFPTGLIRKSYVDHIKGNPGKIFVLETCCAEYRVSGGFRHNLLLSTPPENSAFNMQYKLPSIEESRRLAVQRLDSREARRYVNPAEATSAASASPTPTATGNESGRRHVIGGGASGRVYPPPLGEIIKSQLPESPVPRNPFKDAPQPSEASSRSRIAHERRTLR